MRFNQQTDLSSQRNFQKSVLGLFIAFICALFAAGCTSGGDGGGFIASPGGAGGGVANAGNGSVTFNFVRAQNAIVVPTNTVNLRFEFFTGLEGTGGIVLSETHPFASAVTIDNVPSTAQSSKVTALTAEGFPVAQFTVNVAVAAGQTTTVSSTDGTLVPVTLDTVTANPSSLFLAIGGSDQIVVKLGFSNGEFVSLTGALVSEATFSSSEMTVASVDASGNVTGLLNGVATITADIVDYPGRSVNVTTQVGTGVINPPIVTNLVITSPDGDPVDLPVGTQSSALTVTATFDTVGDKVVTQTDGVTFTSDNPNVSVNANQEIVVAAGASAGETATITANFMGTQDTVGVTVNNAVLQTLSVTPSSVSLPFGGFEQALAIQGNFSNGTSVAIAPDSTFLTYTESPASDRYAVGGDGVAPMGTAVGTIVSAATDPGGTANPQTLRLDYDDGAGQTATANVDVTVGAVMVTSLTITPSPVTLSPGQVQEFVVLANLSQGNPVDVSNFDALTVTTAQAASSMDTDIVANGKQVVAVTSTPDGETATATFAIAGFTQDVAVTVLQEYLTSVRYEFAGNPIVNQTVNLPRGYVGLVECYGTFTSGAQRRLNFNEYTLERSAVNTGDPDDMLHLWNDSFAITQPSARYQDGASAPGSGAFTSTTAVIDDLYNPIRQLVPVGDPNPVAAGNVRGSDFSIVATRSTFRGVVADWPRGVSQRGTVNGGDFVDAAGLVSPGSVRAFTIKIDPSVDNPTTPGLFDQTFTVTVSDPLMVSIDLNEARTTFLNYPTSSQTPTGTVREFDVRADFTEVTVDDTNDMGLNPGARGPIVDAFSNFKLAEANIIAVSNIGGQNQFLFTTPTSLGGIGFSSDFPVDVNTLNLFAVPVGGLGIRPANTTSPGVNATGDYVAAEYELIDRVFGANSTAEGSSNEAGYFPSRDPGPLDDPTANAHITRQPADGLVITYSAQTRQDPVRFIDPVLFSIDPINNMGPLSLTVGQSQIFRTMVQFTAGTQPEERTLDYPPTLVTGSNPGLVGIRELSSGRLTVSAVNSAGDDVVAADVLSTTGYPTLATDADVAAAIAQNVMGVVIALDAVGEPIVDRGNWVGSVVDSRNQTGPSQSVSTVDAAAAP